MLPQPTAPREGGDGNAFCWSHALRELNRHAGMILSDKQDREDAIQEAALRAWRVFEEGSEIKSFAGLLHKKLRESAIDMRRQKQRRARNEIHVADIQEEVGQPPGGSPSRAIDEFDVVAFRWHLHSPYQQWYDDWLSRLSDGELATRDGVTEAAIRQRWSRLERLLRSCASQLVDFLEFSVTTGLARRRRG